MVHDSDDPATQTMDVDVSELSEAKPPRRDNTLDKLLGELEDEVAAPIPADDPPAPMLPPVGGTNAPATVSSIPPPLPAKRPAINPLAPPPKAPPPPSMKTATLPPPPPGRSVPPPPPSNASPHRTSAPPAPPARTTTRSVPPPLPKPPGPPARPPGLGVPGGSSPSIEVPRKRTSTQHGRPPPLGHEDDEEMMTLVVDRESVRPVSLVDSAKEMAKAWNEELSHAEDPARRARLSYELARLHETLLRDPKIAHANYQQTLSIQKDHLPSLRGARRTAIALKDYRGALGLFDAEARITADSRRKAALLLAKGRLLEDALGDADKAKGVYRTAAELDKTDISVLKAIEQRDRASESWSELSRTLEREANAVASDARYRAALIVERARVLEHREQRVEAAIELLETALRIDPSASSALESLERLCHAQRRWRDLTLVLARRAEATEDPSERALAFYRIGRLHAERLGNRDDAITALEAAAQQTPRDPLILSELASMLSQSEQWARLIDVLAQLSEATEDKGEQLALWHRIGNLLDERLGKPEHARTAFERALSLDATHVPTLQALARLYEAAEAWDAMIAMHLAEANHAADAKRRASAHARVAEVLEVKKDDREEAMKHHARALSLSPGLAVSFKALSRLYGDTGRHRSLIELYERAIEQAAESEAAITHLFKVGAIYEDNLGEHEQAAHVYRRILERDAGNLGALHALQRATERAGRHDELVDALEREADLRHDDGRIVELLHRAAEILDERLGDTDGAMKRYHKILEIDPRYAPALAGLGRIYHRTGRWDDLLELYEAELALDPRGVGAAPLLHKMGQLCEERIGDEARAIDCYRRALDAEPRHRPSLVALEQRLAARRDWSELVLVLELELDGLSDPMARARAAYRLGEVYEQHLDAPDRAAGAFESALAAVPGYPPANDALERLRASQSAWRRLADQLEERGSRALAKADAGDDPAAERAAASLFVRAGELFGYALGDPRRAASCYERALEVSPTHLEALLALEQLYRRLSRHDALAKIYGSLARALQDPGARITALRELSRLASRASGHEADVRQINEAILRLAPDDPAALETLEALALASDDRALLAQIDQRLALSAGDAKLASGYQARLAESLESLGDGGALDAYRAALSSDAENIAAAKGLARVALAHGDAAALVEAARGEAQVTPEPHRAARLLVRAAQASQRQLDDSRSALRDYERALELWPDDADAAAGLTELLLSSGQAARAADRLGRAAGSAQSPERVASLWMEVARLQADMLNNVAAAVSSLNRVLKENPSHVPALRQLAELHVRHARWAEAAELLSKVVSLAPDNDLLLEAHLKLAMIWDEHLDDPTRARVSLQAVLSLDEASPEALARLAHLSARTGDPDKAAQTLRRLVEVAADPADEASAWVMLSNVQDQRGDGDAARGAALQAVALEGPDSRGVERHKSLIRDKADWQAHAEALRAWLNTASDPLRRRAGRLEVARILSDELGRPARAVEELEKAVREQPTDVEMRRLLAVNMRQAGNHTESANELRRILHDHTTNPVLWRELSTTFQAAGDLAAARRALMPLVPLGEATPAEREEIARYPSRPGAAAPGALDAALIEAFYPIRRTEALCELLRLLTPGIAKLYPPDLDAYGVASRDRLTSRSSEPVRAAAERVASIFGLGDFSLFLHRARGKGISVELYEPPAIMLPAPIAEMGEAQRTFAFARAMSNIAVGLYAVDRLTPREIEIVLASVARRASPSFGSGLTSEDILEDIGKRTYKGLPRKNRRTLDERCGAYVQSQAVDFAHFVEAIVTSANRIALVVADDLLAVLDVLHKYERDLTHLSGAKLVAHPMVTRLCRFWVSPEADALRQRCGLREPTRTV
ncbi:MAG: tetratricopeptide repeat protein [Sandaracinaceae bacterium]